MCDLALADVLAQVVEEQAVCVYHERPIIVTCGLPRPIGVWRRSPEERSLLLRRALRESGGMSMPS